MLTVFVLLALGAFIVTILHTLSKCALWPAVMLLSVIELLRALPLGR